VPKSTTDIKYINKLETPGTLSKIVRRDSVAEIVIIGGFLGSGKTTLLKRLLGWELSREVSPQVIMSEFGDFNVDGTLIRDNRIRVAKLVGGCVCCDLRDELASSLKRIMHMRPGSHIYIEATGVADPCGILEAISPVIEDGAAVVKKVIIVYDVSRHATLGRDQNLGVCPSNSFRRA
jgi:G3E family GTPase